MDPRHLEHGHRPSEIAKRLREGPRVSYLRDWVYGGIDGTETTRIGVATSDDGITWQKDPEPVLQADSCDKPGARYAALPRLLPDDAGYLVLFEQDREAAMATSADGHEWTCDSPDPLLVAEDVPEGQGIHTMAAT